jgi:hypothetical protein
MKDESDLTAIDRGSSLQPNHQPYPIETIEASYRLR